MTSAWATGADEPVELVELLRALRGPYTQREVALLLGVSTALISSWESGMTIPPAARLRQYADTFGRDGDGLLDDLLEMRRLRAARVRAEPVYDVLRDIRCLLTEIRDRLPPPKPPP